MAALSRPQKKQAKRFIKSTVGDYEKSKFGVDAVDDVDAVSGAHAAFFSALILGVEEPLPIDLASDAIMAFQVWDDGKPLAVLRQ